MYFNVFFKLTKVHLFVSELYIYSDLLGVPERRWQLRQCGHKWENITTDLKILGWEGVVWVCVVRNMDQWPAFVSTVINPYPTAFPYGNGMVLHFYQQQESSTTKTVHKVINKGLKTYV